MEANSMHASTLEASHVQAASLEASTLEASHVQAASLEASTLEASHVQAASLEASTLEASTLEASTLEASTLEASTLENLLTQEKGRARGAAPFSFPVTGPRIADVDPVQVLQRSALFEGVDASDLESLVPDLHRRTFAAGTYVFREGDPGLPVHLIRG